MPLKERRGSLAAQVSLSQWYWGICCPGSLPTEILLKAAEPKGYIKHSSLLKPVICLKTIPKWFIYSSSNRWGMRNQENNLWLQFSFMYLVSPVWTNFTVSLRRRGRGCFWTCCYILRLVRWQHPLIFIFPIEMNLALFLLLPLSIAGCRWVTCTLLLIWVIPGGWQPLKKDALASLALSGLSELEVL